MYLWEERNRIFLGKQLARLKLPQALVVPTQMLVAAAGNVLSSQRPLFHFSVGGMETFTA